MSEYGQSAPALPQIYSNQSTFQFTKAGLTHQICRVLATVGMVPITKLWPYDALNPANAERVLPTDRTWLFFFDFPDTATFTVNGQTWRPFACVAMWTGNYALSSTNTVNYDTWRIDVGVRLSGEFIPANSFTRFSHTGDSGAGSFFGWGAFNQAIDVDDFSFNTTGNPYGNTLGLYIRKGDWKPFASHTNPATQDLITVRNIFCYLGPAGLFLYIGSQTNRSAFGDLIAAGFVFAGGRLPGRALQANDFNLPRINPIVTLPMLDSPSISINNIWNGSRLRTYLHGVQHDQNGHMDMVMADIWNLENAEIPLTPDMSPFTLESPRELTSGQGAHILGRMVVVPKERRLLTTEFVGPIRPGITSASTRPEWFEVFTAPRFRFGDKTAPLGDFEDPDTNENWRIVPHPMFGTLALYSENAVVTSTTSVGTLTEQTPRSYSLTAVSETGSGAFSSTTNVVSTPAGATMHLLRNPAQAGVGNARWSSTAAIDELRLDMLDFTINGTLTELDFTIDIPALEDPEFVYELRFNARLRGAASMEGPQGVNPTFQPFPYVQFFVSSNGVLDSAWFIQCAGTNVSHSSYDFTTYNVPILRDGIAANNPIILRLRGGIETHAATSPSAVAEFNSFSLRAFKYI